MSYDPTKDEPRFSVREVEEIIVKAMARAFTAGREFYLNAGAVSPLTIEGRWKLDTVYAPQSLVYHGGHQWIAKAQTASEPADTNALWRRIDFPQVSDA